MKDNIIQVYQEKDSYISIVTVSKIEFIHKGMRNEEVLIDFKIDQSIHGSINSELIQTSVYYNYSLNGEPPFTVGTKYLVVFRNILSSNVRFWSQFFQELDNQDVCDDLIEFYEHLNK